MAGLFGVGGGLIVVPALIFSFKLQGFAPEVLTHMAVGTSLAVMVVTSLSSIKAHQENKAIQWQIVYRLGVGILLGAFLGVCVAVNISGHLLQTLLGFFAVLIAIKMWLGIKAQQGSSVPNQPILVGVGVLIGGISSLFGIGGGTLSVPFLRRAGLTMQHAVASSAACGFPIALMGAVTNATLGYGHTNLPVMTTGFIYWPAMGGIVLTSVVFAHMGARMAHRLSPDMLQKLFALLLVVVGLKLMI